MHMNNKQFILSNLFAYLLLCSTIAMAADNGMIEREGWSFDRSDLVWPHWSDPVKQRKEGKLNNPAGWVEYDITVEKTGWFTLWQKGVPTEWTRDVFVDGKIYRRLHTSTREDGRPHDKQWAKECNVFLTQGKHTIKFRRYAFPGSLPHKWQLRPAGNDPTGCVIASAVSYKVMPLGKPVTLEVMAGTSTPLQYTLLLKDEQTGHITQGPVVSFPATDHPLTRKVQITPEKQGYFRLLAKSGNTMLKPADLAFGRIIAVDTTPAVVSTQGQETLVLDIDCTSKAAENFFENSTPSVIVNKPLGSYRQTTGPILNDHWGVQTFAYRFDLPDHDHVYKLIVDYPDDDRRTMGFWINDGAAIRNSTGNTVTGGVETGDRYPVTHRMIQHEAIFYPRNHKDMVVAVVNLAPGGTAAAARVRIYQLDGQLPATALGHTRGRKMGYYFEESGRWLKHFGGESSALDQQFLTLQRWARRNRMMGANVMMPTINVYQANHYPSDVLVGYFNRDDDECRMAAMIAQANGSTFVPEFHLSGQVNFDRVVMGVWSKNGKVKFKDEQTRDIVHVNKDGSLNGPWKKFVYNVLHPTVQKKYIAIFGELADRLADCESFGGISSRLMLSWQWQGWNALPGLNAGYSDWTIREFEKDTGIKVPSDAKGNQRYKQRFLYLTGPKRDVWNKWRCDKVFAFHQKLRDRIRQAKPEAQLFLPYHGVGRNTCISDDPVEQLIEIGIDPANYKTQPGIVLMPNAMYGRRRSTPLADSRKWEQAIGKLAGTLAKLGGRGFAFYSDYFEVNKHFDWTTVGGKRYSAFDACTPSGLNERELYAVALAENDSSFLINGGNGHIFGTPSVMLPFLKAYRALPDVQFEALPNDVGGRDPVAVWQQVYQNHRFFYAVNRLSSPVKVTLQLSSKTSVFNAVDDQPMKLDAKGQLVFELEPYMLMSFVCPDTKVKVVQCQTQPTPAFARQVDQVIEQIIPMRDQIQKRKLAVELDQQQVDDLLALMNQSIDAHEQGQLWQAWSNLFLPPMVHLYDLTGNYPEGLFSRQTPRGLRFLPSAPKLILGNMIGDTRGHVSEPDAMAHDAQGNLFVATDQQVMCFNAKGDYLRTLTLLEPHTIDTGDISKHQRLESPRYLQRIRSMWALPNRQLAVAKGWGLLAIYETEHGRLVKTFDQLPGRSYDFVAQDQQDNLLVYTRNPRNVAGLYRVPDGWAFKGHALCLPMDNINGLTVGPKGRIFVSDKNKIRCYTVEGQLVFEQDASLNGGVKHLAVSSDGQLLLAASEPGATLAAYRINTQGRQMKLEKCWDKNMGGRWINALAMSAQNRLTVGIMGPNDHLAVKQLTVDEKGAQATSLVVPTLALLKSTYLKGVTQLKVRDNAIYFISDNNLCRLTPGMEDKIEVVYQSHVQRTGIEGFAFSPAGDLYLTANSGFEANTRGTNVYRAKRDGHHWTQPVKLNGGVPLVKNPYMIPSDIAFDARGRLIIQHVIKDEKRRGPSLVISAVDVDENKINDFETVMDMGQSYGWGRYGLHRLEDGGLLIAGGKTREIAMLSADGKLRFKTQYSSHQGANVLPLRYPTSITMDHKNRIWVSDTGGNQILCFTDDGQLLGCYGHFGNMDVRDELALNMPMGIASVVVDGKQWLYVADINNQRLIKLEVKSCVLINGS